MGSKLLKVIRFIYIGFSGPGFIAFADKDVSQLSGAGNVPFTGKMLFFAFWKQKAGSQSFLALAVP